jgi:hypothetical protein
MRRAEDLKYYRLHQARSGMLLGSAAILLLAVVGGGRNLVEGLKLRQSATSAEQRAGIYQAQFNAAKRRLPETPVEPKDIKTAVDIADTLSRYKATPLQMMRAVSRALDRYPELRIQSLNWLAGTDPNAAVEGEPRAAEDTSAPGSTPRETAAILLSDRGTHGRDQAFRWRLPGGARSDQRVCRGVAGAPGRACGDILERPFRC